MTNIILPGDKQPSKLERQLTYLRNAIAELQARYQQLEIAIVGQQAQVSALLKHLGVSHEQLLAANEILKAEREAVKEENKPSAETLKTIEKLIPEP